MSVIHVKQQGTLEGELVVQGSKNAVLPILAATILIKGKCIIKNCPKISDVDCMLALLECLGVLFSWEGEELHVDTSAICESRLPAELVTCMRASVILMGPLLAVCKETCMNYPGGCVIGERPIDIHLDVLEKLGASFIMGTDSVRGRCDCFRGTEITMRFPSVGATENGILAAVLAKGKTVLKNCAREPEIQELCRFLNYAGADIKGIGESVLRIEGVEQLRPVEYTVEADRIVAGTYMLSVAAVRGNVYLKNAPVDSMRSTIDVIRRLGCDVQITADGIYIRQNQKPKAIPYIKTMVYPGFPTDLQSILITVLSVSEGKSVVEETIFSGRFRIINELKRMGADITGVGNQVYINGVSHLSGECVIAEDLRGGAALVLAGLLAKGNTYIRNCNYISRGYEDICRDYNMLGAHMGYVG